jgi:hypothetical protein
MLHLVNIECAETAEEDYGNALQSLRCALIALAGPDASPNHVEKIGDEFDTINTVLDALASEIVCMGPRYEACTGA